MISLTQLLEQTNPYFLCCMFFNLCSLIPRPLNSLGMGLQSVLTVIHKGSRNVNKPHLRVRLLNWCADNIREQLKKAHFIYLPATKHIRLYLLWYICWETMSSLGQWCGQQCLPDLLVHTVTDSFTPGCFKNCAKWIHSIVHMIRLEGMQADSVGKLMNEYWILNSQWDSGPHTATITTIHMNRLALHYDSHCHGNMLFETWGPGSLFAQAQKKCISNICYHTYYKLHTKSRFDNNKLINSFWPIWDAWPVVEQLWVRNMSALCSGS